MSTISASTTTTTAYKVTADTTGTLVLQTGSTPTTAVTIDASQNVGVGVVPSAWTSTYKVNQILRASFIGLANRAYVAANWYDDGAGDKYIASDYATRYIQLSGTHRWDTAASGTAGAAVTFATVMTIDADGRLSSYNTGAAKQTLFQASHASNPYGIDVFYTGSAPNGLSNQFIYCEDTSAQRMSVRSNGGIANFSANNVNLSDRREKTNFAPAGDYLAKICAIPIQTFNYIDQNLEEDPGLTLGVVAQDVQAVAPELVMESNWAGRNEEPKMRLSIYQTDLQYALMKCIQEQQAIITSQQAAIETLTNRITALEAK